MALIPLQIFDVIVGCPFTLFKIAGMLFFARVLGACRNFWWFACVAAFLHSLTTFSYILNWMSAPTSALLQFLLLLPSYVWILARQNVRPNVVLMPTWFFNAFSGGRLSKVSKRFNRRMISRVKLTE